MSEFLNARQFAEAANVKESTVRAWILYGKISVVRFSAKCVRIPRVELERLMREGFTPARAAR